MTIALYSRGYGMHSLIKSIEIEGEFADYCTPLSQDNYEIQEQKLLDNIPKGFLPASPNTILLSVESEGIGSGQRNLAIFRPWSKYFASYVIELKKERGR